MRKFILVAIALFFNAALVSANANNLALKRSRVNELSDTLLWKYDLIMGRTGADQVLAIKDRAKKVGNDEWADNCLWIDMFCPLAITEYGGQLPDWIKNAKNNDPYAILQRTVYNEKCAGIDWFLRDQYGNGLDVWGENNHLLNLGPDCPKGRRTGPSFGLTAAEYLGGPWRLIFLNTNWKDAYDGLQIEDGPFAVIPDWLYGNETIVSPGPNKQLLTARQFQSYAYPYFQSYIIERLMGYLRYRGLIIRTNGHFDTSVCGKTYLGQHHALVLHLNSTSAKLEGIGGYGQCPFNDFEKWFQIFLDLPSLYRGGYELSTTQTKVNESWLPGRARRWQALTLGMTRLTDMTWCSTYIEPNYDSVIPLIPEAKFGLGDPLSDIKSVTYNESILWYRVFENATIVTNLNNFEIMGVRAQSSQWVSGDFPDGYWSIMNIK